jgi:hypothetical protein
MEDQLSVAGLSGFFIGGVLTMLAELHGWQDSFVLCMIFIAGFVLGSLAVGIYQPNRWYDAQRNLATRYRKLIVALLFCVATLQIIVSVAMRTD